MLTLNALTERLSDFSQEFQSRNPHPKNSPIVLYQSLFGFLHNLKSSIQLSEDSSILSLLETVVENETLLRRLAQDELELPADQNSALHKLATHFDSLESLSLFLKTVSEKAIEIKPQTLPVFSQQYAWESLSRARATSAQRHQYLLYAKTVEMCLHELTPYDEKVRIELTPVGGIDVVRNLQPKPNSNPKKSSELFLEVRHLVAIPREVQHAHVGGNWAPLD